ncbi:hypothetical protein, partial [Chitinophaga sp. RAB17]|uniref:hypothetical protein n=1 Tax=Chitinophaga sp. RAB17 TaxID=3233049 RepID=UPI003F8F7AA1
FGLDITGGASSGLFSGDNIIEFLKSRLMVEKTLLSPVKDGGKVKSLVDLFIESYELNKGWAKYPKLVSLHYPPGADRKSFTLEQDSILGVIFTTLLNDNLEVFKPDKKLSFVTAKCVSKNEVFSKFFVERLVTEATDFYVATKIKRSKTNVDKLQLTADSIELLLNKKTYAIAVKQDINMNPARQVASVATEVASRDKIVLQTMYTEVIKNLELSRMSMAQETPIIQIVDSPILPLKVKKLGKAKGIVLGGIIGGFLICVVLILRRLFKSIMLR